MRWAAAAGLVIATVVGVANLPAHAETVSPTPAPSVTGSAEPSDPFVLPYDGEVLDITFPEANLAGSVTEEGSVITLKADVFFAYNKANLNAKAAAALDQARDRLTELNAQRVRVAGYTDDQGSKSYNLGLSRRRAEAVRSALSRRLPGIAYEVRAFGESRPVATNKTAGGRALNRRVTITVLG